MKLTLTKEITVSGEKVKELNLREPTYDEVSECGMPFTITQDGEIKLDSKATLKYLPIMAEIPPSSARQISPRDLMAVSMKILGFFTTSKA
ncbi:phage tail assembly protein [Yersinia ruckeri]|uniref:phage tail assembly protein n=1 Tax=Yersinia ruckeri TaxID=29486 RepID=UPI0005365165|nr:phage tail assembly protein [Yersinia ruckeri]AUQ42578.1 phage tail assembly protein [Yersinia ruckeri]EKN4197637.1 phage tail assembly protein [Yersinia ruckeri]EKN4203889.1 phage tail assembly protein [Yersinia ruckeri]EKN4701049.1 phage tail assembly protein [Yersinia ruckeri]ELI6453461.1 phage tail assembly protein [Yersinia ruckeri]